MTVLARLAAALLILASCTQSAEAARKPCKKRCQTATTTTTLPVDATTTVPATSTTLEPATTTTATTAAETTTTVAPEQPGPPPLTDVGPRYPFSLTDNPTVNLDPGRYELQNFTGYIRPTGPGTYTFVDSELAGFEAYHPGVTLILDHARVNNGLWFEGGSHDGAEIRWSVVDGGGTQALRPKGPGRILVEDSWLLTHGTPLDPGIHTEALQGLDGAGGTFNRVALSTEPRWADWGTPITAVINVDGPMLFRDVIVGWWNPAYGGGAGRWESGGGYYGIYAGETSTWWRATIYHPSPWYPPEPSGDRLIDPDYRCCPRYPPQ